MGTIPYHTLYIYTHAFLVPPAQSASCHRTKAKTKLIIPFCYYRHPSGGDNNRSTVLESRAQGRRDEHAFVPCGVRELLACMDGVEGGAEGIRLHHAMMRPTTMSERGEEKKKQAVPGTLLREPQLSHAVTSIALDKPTLSSVG